MNKFLLLFPMGLLISCAAPNEKDSDPIEARIARVENGLQPNLQIKGDSVPHYNIEERMKTFNVAGLSMAVLRDGQIEWAKAYGVADSASGRKVTTETLFQAASISKPVAATRAHQLMEAGKLDLDANVNDYLTSWKVPENEFTTDEKVTAKRIMNHSAGLTVWGFAGYHRDSVILSMVEVLNGLGNSDSVLVYKEPGESWQYSGGGYTIMQLMISDMEGEPFPDIMRKNVLDPLGMSTSTFEQPLPQNRYDAAATGYRSGGEPVEGNWHVYPEMAAAGLWTTPSELIQWPREIQKIYQTKEDGLLKYETVKKMLKSGDGDHGLGPGSMKHFFGHGGANEGFRSEMRAWKKEPFALVIMVNSDNNVIFQEILLSLAEEYDLPGVGPIVKTMKAQTEEELQRFVGTFNFEGFGSCTFEVHDRGLRQTADWADEGRFWDLLPSGDHTFFTTDIGEDFTFVMEGDSAVALKVQGYEAVRTK